MKQFLNRKVILPELPFIGDKDGLLFHMPGLNLEGGGCYIGLFLFIVTYILLAFS